MRFCADSIRSCFFIRFCSWNIYPTTYGWNNHKIFCKTCKGCVMACGSSPSSMGTHISFYNNPWKNANHEHSEESKRSSKVECMRTTNLAQTTVSLPSPLVGFHLQVDFLNKIHLLFSVHKPS